MLFFISLLFAFSLACTLLFYIACTLTSIPAQQILFRSSIILVTAFINGLILVYFTWSIFALIPALICSLALIKPLCKHRTFHSILSYLNFALPLSMIVIVPGLVLFLLNIISHPFCYFNINFIKITKLKFNFRYANFLTHGGLIKIRKGYAGFNMGCCSFVNQDNANLALHEYGHQLNLAVFGGWFHYIGAIDENYYQSNPANAYAELLADSIVNKSNNDHCMWS